MRFSQVTVLNLLSRKVVHLSNGAFREKEIEGAQWFFYQQTDQVRGSYAKVFFSSLFANCYRLQSRFPARTHAHAHISHAAPFRESYRPRGAVGNSFLLRTKSNFADRS